MKVAWPGEAFWSSPFTADDQAFREALPRYFMMAVAISTVSALVICLIFSSWRIGLTVFLIANCTGLSIFVVLCSARLTFMRGFRGGIGWQRVIYFALIVVGALAGKHLGQLLTHRASPHSAWSDALTAIVFSSIGAFVAIVVNTGLTERTKRREALERAERVAIEAQLRVLQAQIEPHFLFNSLANLDALIATDAVRARHMLANLIRYLRAALMHSRSEKATLHTEIEQLKAYLAIMAIRLPDRLTSEFDCDPDCMRLAFPPMMLQPLVENAITHGIEPTSDGGTISIKVHRSVNMLLISVDDTGIGLGNAHTVGTGAGIQNIRARLKSLFGDSAKLTLEARQPHGTHAGIEVPLQLLSEG